MNLKEIKEIIKLIDEAKLQEVEIEQENIKIRIKRQPVPQANLVSPQVIYQQAPVAHPPAVHEAAPAPVASPEPKAAAPAPVAAENLKAIKSPMTGTFYSSPSPDKPPFVAAGKEVKPGEPVCIIEAMKLFNEIESDETGTIEKILVQDGQPVELDQPLFLLRA